MVEKFLHTSDLLRVFLLFCLVKRISYSFPPCFLRCELLFISYISLQMHHVDMVLAQESPASSTQFTCLSKSENFYEFRHNRMHPDARMHISSRCLDALDKSHRTKKNVVLHDMTQPDTLFPWLPIRKCGWHLLWRQPHSRFIYLYMHCFPNRSLAALLANAKHRTECHRT